MKRRRFFLSFVVSAILVTSMQIQVQAHMEDNVNILNENNELKEIVKQVFPEYKDRIEHPQIKQSDNHMSTRNTVGRKIIFK